MAFINPNILFLSGQSCICSVIHLEENRWKKFQSVHNWSPTSDTILVNSSTLGSFLVTCSGNSLYRFQFGFGIEHISTQDQFQGANGIWPLYSQQNTDYHSYLVISFLTQTRIYERIGSTLEDRSATFGFKTHQSTLLASSLTNGCFIQVLPSIIHITHEMGMIQGTYLNNSKNYILSCFLNSICFKKRYLVST